MTQSTFRMRIALPRQIQLEGRKADRDDFYSWAWAVFTDTGLLGIHEGTVLSEDAAHEGLETESWTIDSGEAPRERDWIGHQDVEEAELYFDTPEHAAEARIRIFDAIGIEADATEEQKPQDWDAEWKASFQGVSIPPFWEIVPPWKEAAVSSGKVPLRLNPGAGFGTGTHETTQLCLQAVGELTQAGKLSLKAQRVLDFGSGSGILAIGAALLGAKVDAVEIDSLAIDNSEENARLNAIEASIHYSQKLASGGKGAYRLVFANILKPVLLQFAPELCTRLAPQGVLVLSGLMQPDVVEVRAAYSALLKREPSSVRELGEWRAIVWS